MADDNSTYLLYVLADGSMTDVVRADALDAKEAATALLYGIGAGETLTKVADALDVQGREIQSITLNADGDEITAIVYKTGRSAVYNAALDLHLGLIRFREYVLRHAAGVPVSAVNKVDAFLHQAHRAAHLVVRKESNPALTDAQIVAWCTTMRFGPLDTSVITALGVYDLDGLFAIFEKADDASIATPTEPQTWVDLDTTTWTADGDGNANVVPKRLNVADIERVHPAAGQAVSQYLDVYGLSWLEGV